MIAKIATSSEDPTLLLANTVSELRADPDAVLVHRFGLWSNGRLKKTILWLDEYEVDWDAGTAKPAKAQQGLRRRTDELAVSLVELLAAVRRVRARRTHEEERQQAAHVHLASVEPDLLAILRQVLAHGEPVEGGETSARALRAARKLDLASDDQVHACIEALFRAQQDGLPLMAGEPPMNRDVLFRHAPKWLAESYHVKASQPRLRNCWMTPQHKTKRQGIGKH